MTLFLFGLPVVLAGSALPDDVHTGAELLVGAVIIALAVRLLAMRLLGRWRRRGGRSPRQAFGIGLVHGVGGSAGVGILLLAGVPGDTEAVVALALFATGTAVSMTLLSAGFGWALTRGPVVERIVAVTPALGVLSLAFGVWYTLAALDAVPYPL
jgi:cytochrome c biogenesis protein CcdA